MSLVAVCGYRAVFDLGHGYFLSGDSQVKMIDFTDE